MVRPRRLRVLAMPRPAEDAVVLAKSALYADAETLEKMAYVREKLLARDVAIELFARARALHARNRNATGEARATATRAVRPRIVATSATAGASGSRRGSTSSTLLTRRK